MTDEEFAQQLTVKFLSADDLKDGNMVEFRIALAAERAWDAVKAFKSERARRVALGETTHWEARP